MPVFMAGMDHRDSWSLTGAVLGQGFLHARCCATCGVLVQRRSVLAVPQLQFIMVVVTPCCFAEADPHGPGCSDDHLHSTVAVL